jgi:predicted MPP superfamily phosphohydrolase
MQQRGRAIRPVKAVAAVGVAGLAWGLFESQWVQLNLVRLPVAGLPPALEGLRIGHLSDLHVGAPSLNARALARGVELIQRAEPDLVVISGDLRARRSGDAALRRSLSRLEAPLGAFAVLGNHDHADGHDPFADGAALSELEGTPVRILSDEAVSLTRGGARILVGGIAPRTFEDDPDARGAELVDPAADLRVLACHFPRILDRLQPGEWQVVLTGHLHGGQLCIPYPGGRFRLAHLSRDYLEGVYVRQGTAMHLSRGLGTTFVPFRFAARPEVTLLQLHAA